MEEWTNEAFAIGVVDEETSEVFIEVVVFVVNVGNELSPEVFDEWTTDVFVVEAVDEWTKGLFAVESIDEKVDGVFVKEGNEWTNGYFVVEVENE